MKVNTLLQVFALLLALSVAQFVLAADSEVYSGIDAETSVGPWLDLQGGGWAEGAPQTRDGVDGRLVNGSLLPAKGLGFRRLSSQAESWGAGHMISLLTAAAQELTTVTWPGMTLAVGDIAREFGGAYSPHRSHQNGLDVDILFIGNQSWRSVLDEQGQVTERFDPEMNWRFWRSLFDQKIIVNGRPQSVISMILVSPEIKDFLCVWSTQNRFLEDPENLEMMKRIRATEGHDDHFHLRLHCSPHHPLCLREGVSQKLGCR